MESKKYMNEFMCMEILGTCVHVCQHVMLTRLCLGRREEIWALLLNETTCVSSVSRSFVFAVHYQKSTYMHNKNINQGGRQITGKCFNPNNYSQHVVRVPTMLQFATPSPWQYIKHDLALSYYA